MQQKGTKKRSNGKKRNFIPKQNTHDLLVGTLSIGIPSCIYAQATRIAPRDFASGAFVLLHSVIVINNT